MLTHRFAVALLLFGTLAISVQAKPIEITVDQLIAHPQHFHRKIVSVTGWFECEFEAGCEVRSTRARQDRLKTILLEFSQQQSVALESTHPLRGRLHVVGRLEYSRPTPEQVVHKADPRDPRDRGIVRIWQGFNFHACKITVSKFERI